MAPDGRDKRNLTRSPDVADWSPAFSPDGSLIAFMSMAGGAPEVWLIERDGADMRQLTRAGELSEYPTWSPDARFLAYGGVRGGNFEILRTAVDGWEEQNLTRSPAKDQWPAWSPDGKSIAFMSDRDGGEDVFVMPASGGGARNVTRTPELYESHPTWTPDGRLSFLRHGESGPVSVRVVDLVGPLGVRPPGRRGVRVRLGGAAVRTAVQAFADEEHGVRVVARERHRQPGVRDLRLLERELADADGLTEPQAGGRRLALDLEVDCAFVSVARADRHGLDARAFWRHRRGADWGVARAVQHRLEA